MSDASSVDERLPFVRIRHDFEQARAQTAKGPAMRALRRAAERVGAELSNGPKVHAVRTLPISRIIYPASFAFQGALALPLPFVCLTHRCLLVQFYADGALRNLLFNPTDRECAKETPYFRRWKSCIGQRQAEHLVTSYGTVEAQLQALGIAPEDIDLVAFDHLHAQDLRPLLGTLDDCESDRVQRCRFPNAHLLVAKCDWEDWDDLHPLQRPWFVRNGKRSVRTDRVVFTDADLQLGDGCMLVRTPGHTRGNQTLFVHGADGVFGCSENGVSCDSWAPYESRLPGLRRFARDFGVKVVLNANTAESTADQYNSMILESTLVDRLPSAPAFPQMFPSSELTPTLIAPGVRPSVTFDPGDFGSLCLQSTAA
ncbi:MAG: hypothetical protein AAF355_11015 [Myxococcota bacterium]